MLSAELPVPPPRKRKYHQAIHSVESTPDIRDDLPYEVPHQPPLSFLSTTPKNLSKFLVRLDPIITIQTHLLEIIYWTDFTKSFSSLLLWISLCTTYTH
jgi:hypothetical protein